MLTLPPTVKIYVARQPVNMRKSFNGLTGVVRAQLELDPTSGHLFCFFNRRRTLMKILFCDDTGYSIFYKRLARGTFQLPDFTPDQNTVNGARSLIAGRSRLMAEIPVWKIGMKIVVEGCCCS
jgi:transposase